MKKRNLILSLICSIILTITLVSFTIVGVLSPKNTNKPNGNQGGNISIEDPVGPQINDGRTGGAEDPYYVYDAESFMDLVSANSEAYFELYNDIDFAGVDFVPMYANGTSFKGHIDGKGHSIKNVSINVTRNNLSEVIYNSSVDQNRFNAHIAMFGEIENAEIVNVNFENMNVTVDDEVYAHINNLNDLFGTENNASLNEITVATVAGVAKNSTIRANVNAVINADAYGIYANKDVQGFNAVGGVVGVANGCTISGIEVVSTPEAQPVEGEETESTEQAQPVVTIKKANIDVKFVSKNGGHYFVGGVTGYAYNTTISELNAKFDVTCKYDQVLYVGGVSGYGNTVDINNVSVELSAVEAEERFDTQGVETINEAKFTWVAGVVNVIRANNNTQLSNISNVTVKADVDVDAIYAGVVVEVRSTDKVYTVENMFVTIEDIYVNSNVNTLQAFGIAKNVSHTKVAMSNVDAEGAINEYDVILTGKILLKDVEGEEAVASASVCVTLGLNGDVYCVFGDGYDYSQVRLAVSSNIFNNLKAIEKFVGNVSVVA